MRFARACGLPLLLVALNVGWAPPREETAAERALREKGLTKSATAFVIEDEKPVLAKMKEARAASHAYAAMSDQHATHQQLAQQAGQLEEQRAELQTQVDQLNQQIGENNTSQPNPGPPGGGGMGGMGGGPNGFPGRSVVSPLTIQRDQLKATLAEVTTEQKRIKNQSPLPKDTTALEARVKRAEETLKELLADLRKQVDDVKQKYADLDGDATVKQALGEAKKGNPKLHIGPSDGFNSGVKELTLAERQFLGKRPAAAISKKKSRSKK